MSSTTFQTHSLPTSTDTYSSNCGRTGAHGLKASPSRSGEWHHLYRAQKHRKLLRSRKKYPREKMKKNKIINIKLRIMIIFDGHGNFLFLKESDRFTFILLRFMTYICFPWEILLEVDILGYQISSFQAHILYNNAITMLSSHKNEQEILSITEIELKPAQLCLQSSPSVSKGRNDTNLNYSLDLGQLPITFSPKCWQNYLVLLKAVKVPRIYSSKFVFSHPTIFWHLLYLLLFLRL